MMAPEKLVRCAIYTRKSSEEGLEQSFNSLHAQREACEAYALSQKHEGWQVLPAAYDDGGFSGGTMERPGLKRLMIDISEGLVDTIVVYKVDRLTRSLADFAKIVESLDSKGVSFVSVTQQFNTTTSMGRLTLNVLLSFAQFEREVTGERIRDKVAASKKKGMWMGGIVPLGYDHVGGELIMNEAEAVTVRHIFQRYLELKSFTPLQEDLKDTGFRSKLRKVVDGKQLGGAVLSRGTLYHLLSNPVYIGKTLHKNDLYPGLHKPIVDMDTWEQTAELLKLNRVTRKRTKNAPSGRMLLGLLKTGSGCSYSPTHSAKGGRRYFYYSIQSGKLPDAEHNIRRLPAAELEELVIAAVGRFFGDSVGLARVLPGMDMRELQLASSNAEERRRMLREGTAKQNYTLVRRIVSSVLIVPGSIRIEVNKCALYRELLDKASPSEDATTIVWNESFQIARRGNEARLILSDGARGDAKPSPLLAAAVVQARTWAEWIVNGKINSLNELAEKIGRSRQYTSRILCLAALSPVMTMNILNGDHPPAKSVDEFSRELSLLWRNQSHSEL